jgi:hypothetical protein
MLKSVLLASLLCGGCFLFPERNPELRIHSPAGGTLIDDHEPIQIFVDVFDMNLDDLRLTVDGVPVPNIVASPSANGQFCEACEIRVTWGGFEAKEGLHVIGIDAVSDGTIEASDTLDLIFEDEPEIVRISPARDADLAGFGMVRVEVDVIERGRATMKLDIDGVEATVRDSNECNRAQGCQLTYAWDTSQLAAGTHELHITITDDDGHTIEDTRSVTLDDVIQVTGLGVTGVYDEDTATLELEVYAFDADTNAFLGCAGSKHGLANADVSDVMYEVDAVLVKAGSDPSGEPVFLRGSDLATRTIRFEVWEDDDLPTCPSALEPIGNDLVGVSPARSYTEWRDTTQSIAFGNVTGLTLAVGRPRSQ